MDNNIHITNWKSPFGEIIIGDYNDHLCICDWRYRKMRATIDKRIQKIFSSTYIENTTPIIIETINQLTQYFEGNRQEFDLPILLAGSDFQKLVWEELLKIPYGKTQTYLDLSKIMGNEKAIRAIASANGANAISIIIPCHRIIGSDGKLVGYAGGLSVKKRLLKLENALNNPQLDLFED